ncbi:MAG: TrbG/VirB9 family P-type conjugative transfer protein, partial [Terriglobia bacterium]
MTRRIAFICFLGTAQLFAADPATPAAGAAVAQQSRTIAVHAKDVIPVNAQIRETTLIVLPKQEKVMIVYCGDKDNWVIDGTENFVTVKPAKVGARTDVHILTDHGNAYTLSFTEVSNVPGAVSDLKLFLQPADNSL